MARPLPNILGCAVGFCAIGSGVGSVAGCFVAAQVWKAMPEAERAGLRLTSFIYDGMFQGIAIGMALGAAAGVAYAVIVRRSRASR